MKILPIINNKNIQNFCGEKVLKRVHTRFYEPNAGCLDDWSRSAPPKCTYHSYVYHPFKGESIDTIEDEMIKGNFAPRRCFNEEDETFYYESSETKLGKSLPFSEEEWEDLSIKEKESSIKLVEED